MAASDSSIYENWMFFSKYQIEHRITFPGENLWKKEEVRKICAALLSFIRVFILNAATRMFIVRLNEFIIGVLI